MDSTRENKISAAIAAFQDPSTTDTLQTIVRSLGLPLSTVRNRLNGVVSRSSIHQQLQLLTPEQEWILEDQIIRLAQLKCIPTSIMVREMAGKILCLMDPHSPIPSKTWLKGFLRRSHYVVRSKRNTIDAPRVRESGENLISLFFERLALWETRFEITPDRIWNLDESGFHIGKATAGAYGIAPAEYQNTISLDSSDLVTALETVSADGRILPPLLIYKGVHLMRAWFPDQHQSHAALTTSPSAFINSEIFFEWFSTHFPFDEERWQLLILDGHKSHTTEKFMMFALRHKVIPLYLPAHMSNVLQPLDRTCFGTAKQHYRRDIGYKFAEGLEPSKLEFFESYMRVRITAYTPKTIVGGWKKSGIFPRDPEVAAKSFRVQMNKDLNPSVAPTPSNLPPASNSEIEAQPTTEMDSPSSVTPRQNNWRSVRMSLLKRSPVEIVRVVKKDRAGEAEAHTRIAMLEQELARTKNQLSHLQRDRSTRPRLNTDKNKLIFDLLPTVLNESTSSSDGRDVGEDHS